MKIVKVYLNDGCTWTFTVMPDDFHVDLTRDAFIEISDESGVYKFNTNHITAVSISEQLPEPPLAEASETASKTSRSSWWPFGRSRD